MWPAATLLFFGRAWLVGAFTSDPAVAELAAEYLAYSSALLFFSGLYFVAFRSLQAAGDMSSPMVISLALAGGLGIPLALAAHPAQRARRHRHVDREPGLRRLQHARDGGLAADGPLGERRRADARARRSERSGLAPRGSRGA